MTTFRAGLLAKCIAVGVLGGIVAGCASSNAVDRAAAVDKAARDVNEEAEKTGNPYRAHVTDMGSAGQLIEKVLIGTPAPTVADKTLKHDVLARIGELETRSGAVASSTPPVLLETRFISKSAQSIAEVWVIARGQERAAYTVAFTTSPKGGTDFHVKGPWRE